MASEGEQSAIDRQNADSMVKKHHDKLQAEKEAAGIKKLQANLPSLSQQVLALALKDCQLDAERALMLLRQFQSDAFDGLAALQHKRRRLQQLQLEAGQSSDSDSGHRQKKSSKRKRKDSKKDKHKKAKHKDKHKRRKHRHAERSASEESDAGPLEFGSHGIIREGDYALKRPEFAAWATEVKHIDIDSLPRGDERELFSTFMEDFNTCTLPHRKYYDLAAYSRKQAEQAGQGSPQPEQAYHQDDERLRRAELMEQRRQQQDQSARDAMSKMMMTKEHLSELKNREMMRLQAQEAYKTGDMNKAQKLMKKLNPDEDTRDLEHY